MKMTLEQANRVWAQIDMKLKPNDDNGYDLIDLQLHEVRDENVPLDPMYFDTAEVIWYDSHLCWVVLCEQEGISLPKCECWLCTGATNE